MVTAIAFDPHADAPLHRQLYEAIRGAVVAGRLRPGARMPSTRYLSEQLDLARNTVLNVFERLLAEGYLVARAGSGTFVADELPERALRAARTSPRGPGAETAGAPPELSARGRELAANSTWACVPPREPGSEVAFRPGLPAVDTFPYERWGKLLARRWNRSGPDLYDHGDPRGYAPLREAVCEYLATARGVRCDVEQVLITAGTQQATSLAAAVLLNPGDRAWVEDPGYPFARAALVAAGAAVSPVPVDDEGIIVAEGIRRCPDAKVAVVTPAHQFPLGHAMSPRRRVALLEWARAADAWIVEDDYDSEFRYVGRPLAALQGEDPDGRVVYCGTFSKVLTPALRVGYLVAPRALADVFLAAKVRSDLRSPPLEQAVLADFIAGGHFARHVRRMRVLYAERQEALLDAARRHAPSLTLRPSAAGMQLIGWLPEGVDDRAAAARVMRAGLSAFPVSAVRVEPSPRGGLILGYAPVPAERMADCVRRLHAAVTSRD
jgi:GntR family transcriptional regulator/MocR family aminotransferase